MRLREAKDKYLWNCLHSKVRVRPRLLCKMERKDDDTWLDRLFAVTHCIVIDPEKVADAFVQTMEGT